MEQVLGKIYKSTLKFLTPLSLEDVYRVVVNEAMRLVKAEIGTIILAENGQLRRAYASDPFLYTIKPRKKGYIYRVYKTGKAQFLTRKQISEIHPEIQKMQVRSDIITPLSYQKKSIGVLSVMSTKRGSFSKQDLHVLQLFVPLATLAIIKNRLYNETREALETRDLFISMASHELKTPLTTLAICAKILKNKVEKGEELDEKLTDGILKEVKRLTKLTNELLQVRQIHSGKMHYSFERCDVREIVKEAISDFYTHNGKRKIVLKDSLNKNNTINADRDKFLQLFTNLLANAAKFSPPTFPITVDVRYKKPYITILVKDNGKGISKKDLPHVFDRFYRGSNHRHEGMGIGLYLAREIVEEHGGKITVQSKINKGTTVAVSLPE